MAARSSSMSGTLELPHDREAAHPPPLTDRPIRATGRWPRHGNDLDLDVQSAATFRLRSKRKA